MYCEQVAASETNYVKQHENSQGANADREREAGETERVNLQHVKGMVSHDQGVISDTKNK